MNQSGGELTFNLALKKGLNLSLSETIFPFVVFTLDDKKQKRNVINQDGSIQSWIDRPPPLAGCDGTERERKKRREMKNLTRVRYYNKQNRYIDERLVQLENIFPALLVSRPTSSTPPFTSRLYTVYSGWCFYIEDYSHAYIRQGIFVFRCCCCSEKR